MRVDYLQTGAMGTATTWVFGRIISHLRERGYDDSNLRAAPYDWRMCPAFLEKRDQYFTKMCKAIEGMSADNQDLPVVLVAHFAARAPVAQGVLSLVLALAMLAVQLRERPFVSAEHRSAVVQATVVAGLQQRESIKEAVDAMGIDSGNHATANDKLQAWLLGKQACVAACGLANPSSGLYGSPFSSSGS